MLHKGTFGCLFCLYNAAMKKDFKHIRNFLAQQQQRYLYRSPRLNHSPQQPDMVIDGEKILTFCSNDYLGLANHPELIQAFQQAAANYGVGSGAAHLINGHNIEHQRLEEALAAFTGRERALLFSTGYMANLGAIGALTSKGESLYQDRLNHASLMDAGRLSDAKMWRYQHSDMSNLRQRIARSTDTASMIVTDGVFSMDGDCANLKELANIATEHQSWLMVDDAHGFGVLGETGAGLVEQEGLSSDDVPVLMATLGKGAGTAGAFIAGDHDLIEFLIQSARTYIFTTAMPPAIAAAGCKSLELMQKETWRRNHLQQLVTQFKQGADQLGLPMMPSDTAIQPILVGGSDKALCYSQQLLSQGILVTAIRPPTVPAGEARLRITLSAAHTTQHVEQLLSALGKLNFSTEK